LDPYSNTYLSNSNCQNGIDDWNNFAQYLSNGVDVWEVNTTNGYITSGPTSCGYPSDVRLKRKIETIYDALEKIMKLEAVEYDWNTNLNQTQYEYFEKNKRLHAIGLIAQNVRLYFPEVISINGEGYYYIEYNKLNSVLVEAIKSQQVFIEDIKEQINELENKLS
jgi:hypothetical protein